MHGAALLRATFPQSFLIPNALTMCGSAFPNQEECHQLQQQQKTFKNKRASSKNNTFSNLCQPRAMMCTHLPRNICQGTLGSSNFHLEQSLAQANVSSTLGRIWKGSPTLTHWGHHFRASLRASSFRISVWHCSRSLLDMLAHGNFVFLVEEEPRVASQACWVSCNVNHPYVR